MRNISILAVLLAATCAANAQTSVITSFTSAGQISWQGGTNGVDHFRVERITGWDGCPPHFSWVPQTNLAATATQASVQVQTMATAAFFRVVSDSAPSPAARTETSEWVIVYSKAGTTGTLVWGRGNDLPAPGDYRGCGSAEPAIYDTNQANWRTMPVPCGWLNLTLGTNSSFADPADFDGDGMADPAVYDESTGNWTFFFTGSGLTSVMNWGFPGATPALGDYDGDGKSDACVYCPPSGTWYARSVPGLTLIFFGFVWGETNTVAVPADYDGDGVTDLATYTPTSGLWHIRNSSDLFTNDLFWGWSNAIPVPADYDGDGRYDRALYTTTDGTWHVAFTVGITQSFPCIDSRISRTIPVPADYDGDHVTDRAVYIK